MAIKNLWVIMPVYNEEEAVSQVVEEWQACLSEHVDSYTFCIINDGSKDNTLNIIRGFEKKYQQIQVVDKPNSGHGQTCIWGYDHAISNGAEWVFQIDSDGQCAPEYFPEFVRLSDNHRAIYGYRQTRDDGLKRSMISRFVTLFTFGATGEWVRDANVPYRLIHADILKQITPKVPKSFHLANILVSVLTNKLEKIKWVNIHFRDRVGGTPSVKTISFVKHGFKLFNQLKEASTR